MTPGSFELNKIVGAILLASVVAMVSGFAALGLYTGSMGEHGGHHEEKRGYSIAVAEGASAATTATADTGPVDIAPFMATADAAAGQGQLKKCTACHTFDNGGKNGVGPNQWALIGSHYAHKTDYAYSDALKAKHSETWTEQNLSDFLANPKKAIPGNKMSFAGMKDPQDRANLIAYLKTLK